MKNNVKKREPKCIRTCKKCGGVFKVINSGNKRIYCYDCSPAKLVIDIKQPFRDIECIYYQICLTRAAKLNIALNCNYYCNDEYK